LAVVVLLGDAEATSAHGGTGAVILDVMLESLFSTLMAPIVMLQHSWYVFTILMGMATGWGAQQRTDRALPLGFATRRFALHTLIGVVATFILWHYAPDSFAWFVPLLAGMWLAIPLVALSSSPLLGREARRDGLFLVPSETRGLKVMDRAHALATARQAHGSNVCHLALLPPTPPGDTARRGALLESARRRETAAFSRDDWTLLLSDAEALRAL
jgi:membrane glycosyltransferase